MECGLLGRKLGHSYSPQIHAMVGGYEYKLFEVEPEGLADFLQNHPFRGLNVTIPYKKSVIPCLDELSDRARRLGAVNTIVRRGDGSLIGHNTDYGGFLALTEGSGLCFAGKKALVLGSGGASNTVCAVLRELGAEPVVISRTGENNYTNLSRHADASLLVNATPVGMYPAVEDSPVDLTAFPKLEGVFDVIYNPARTRLLLQAENMGLPAFNGLKMLVGQALESAEWFTGRKLPDGEAARISRALRAETENLVLIGMPGSGKTSIGRALAAKLNREFVDADEELEKRLGVPIAEFIPAQGEDAFRAAETQVLRELGKRSGLVLATGGGCVTREENRAALRCNGFVVRLHRNLELLPTDGRPLSQKGSLAEMARVREPLYRRFADAEADNNGAMQDTVETILQLWEERT